MQNNSVRSKFLYRSSFNKAKSRRGTADCWIDGVPCNCQLLLRIQSFMFCPVSSSRFLVRTAKTKSDTNPVYFILEAQNLDSLLRVNSENKRYSVIERVLPSAEHETEPFTAERLSRKEVLHSIWFIRDRAIRASTEILAKIRDTQY